MHSVWLKKMTISLPLLTCDTNWSCMLLATLCDTDQSFAGLLMLGDLQRRTLVCNHAINLRYCCKWGKIHYIKIAESESVVQTCWPVIYRRDVYRSIRDTEHLSTSFQSLGSPKHTCLELRPGAGFCGQFVATLWFSDTWQETREHVESTDSDHLPGVQVSAGVHIY